MILMNKSSTWMKMQQSMIPLRKLLSLQSGPWKRSTTLRGMSCTSWIPSRSDKSLQDSLNRLLKKKPKCMILINSLNTLLQMRPSIYPLRNLLSLHSDQWWRNMILRDMLYSLKSLRLIDKNQKDNLYTKWRKEQNMIPRSNFPSQL